jgi:hypothetical protein
MGGEVALKANEAINGCIDTVATNGGVEANE